MFGCRTLSDPRPFTPFGRCIRPVDGESSPPPVWQSLSLVHEHGSVEKRTRSRQNTRFEAVCVPHGPRSTPEQIWSKLNAKIASNSIRLLIENSTMSGTDPQRGAIVKDISKVGNIVLSSVLTVAEAALAGGELHAP